MFFNEARLFQDQKLADKHKDHAKQSFKKLMDELKKRKEEGRLMPSDIKKVIHAIYKLDSEDIVDDTINVFQFVRFVLSVGLPFAIHPALALVGWLTNKIIEEKVNERYEKEVMAHYNGELRKVKRKLEDPNLSDDEKEALSNTKRTLEENIMKLQSYYSSITKHKQPIEKERHVNDFDFSESMEMGTSGKMIYSDEEMDRAMIRQLKESVDQMIEVISEHAILSEKGELRHSVKTGMGKVKRIDRRASDKIDDVGDAVIDGTRKSEKDKMRQEILDGRLKISTVIKRAIAIGTVAAFSPALAAIGAFVYLCRKGMVKKKQRQELLFELKKELEVVEEKIKDAESENDKKKKYQYMRIRTQLKRSIDRIRYFDSVKEI